MRHLWFGGSFNPIHYGHLICARAVAEACGFDRLILVPSGQPPHKSGDSSVASPGDRLEMCRLAVAGDPFFQVDDLEVTRPGFSYTIDTARALRADGATKVSWLIGADMALSLPAWHKPAELLAEVHFVLMRRPGWTLDWQKLPQNMQMLQSQLVDAPLVEISSTGIRRRLAEHRPIRYLTPDPVIDYIQRRQLYGS